MTHAPELQACVLPPGSTNADGHECVRRAELNRLDLKSRLRTIEIHQRPCRRD